MDNINVNLIPEHVFKFELTSEEFNTVIREINDLLDQITSKINDMIDATEGIHPSSAISHDPSTVAWLNDMGVDNVKTTLDAISLLLTHGEPLHTEGGEKKHESIDHTGIDGIADVVQADYDELVGGESTEKHRHDMMYLTKTELVALGVNPLTHLSEFYFETGWEFFDQNTNVLNINHGLDLHCDGVLVMYSVNSDGSGSVQANCPGHYNGSTFIGFSTRYDNNNINISAGDYLIQDAMGQSIEGYVKIKAYRFK